MLLNCQQDNDITISGLKASYYYTENINYNIKNISDSNLYYYVSIEYYNDEKWEELINDIKRPTSMSSEIMLIKPNQVVQNSIPLKNIFYLDNFLKFKKYRLKINYGYEITMLNKISLSEDFKIKK
jgi:hypothetical protein